MKSLILIATCLVILTVQESQQQVEVQHGTFMPLQQQPQPEGQPVQAFLNPDGSLSYNGRQYVNYKQLLT